MATLRNNKRNSVPSFGLGFNKFMVSKRASMFESHHETQQEKRDRSPCGMLEVSARKLEARKDIERKKAAMARRKRRADPYADQSSAPEDDIIKSKIKQKPCHHSSCISMPQVRKAIKPPTIIGECVGCAKLIKQGKEVKQKDDYKPQIWMCLFCGYQGCDRESSEEHALNHYRTPRSDKHCIILNTQYWTVWCRECDCEVPSTCSKQLHELVQLVKRKSDLSTPPEPPPTGALAPPDTGRSRSAVRSSSPSVNTSRARGSSANFIDDKQNKNKTPPKLKGISNLGNTCYFNSVLQVLAQTQVLTEVFDDHLQTGVRVNLPGTPDRLDDRPGHDTEESEEEIVLKPLDVMLPEAGGLSLSLANFLKDMNGHAKSNILSPGHLFGQICKKSSQFQGYEQQDAHELLRCLLDLLRAEELHRIKKGILKCFALSDKIDPSKVPTTIRKIIKGYGQQATHTIVDQVFGGQLISTIVCEECQWSSVVLEPFMDLSLSVSEDKGKPKNHGSDENLNSSSGRGMSSSGGRCGGSGLSKYHLKKQRKLAKKNKRQQQHHQYGGKNKKNSTEGTETSERISDNVTDEVKRRMTEKRRPGDEQFTQEQKEQLTKKEKASSESKKYKVLMAVRNAQKKEELKGDSSEEEEEDDEELEYDQEEDEDHSENISLGDDTNKSSSNNRYAALANATQPGQNTMKLNGVKGSESSKQQSNEVDEDEEEEEDDDEDEDDEEEDSSEEEEEEEESSSVSEKVDTPGQGSKSKENCDADEEDNAESEFPERITRHPSIIVVDHSEGNDPGTDAASSDGRYLSTSASCDHLNYNSASDTSERYFTADAIDEDLDYPRRHSVREDDIAHRLQDLKLQRKSSSKESLYRHALKTADGLHSSRSIDKLQEVEEDAVVNASHNQRKSKQEWLTRSLTTVAPKYQPAAQECSVMSGLSKFTAPELLANNNKIICQNCTKLKSISGETEDVRSPARKQMMIVCPPAVLTLQLKRFHNVGFRLAKANNYVKFPLVLDLAPFTSTIAMFPGCRVLYGLYGIVQHVGRLHNGHYTAFVKRRNTEVPSPAKCYLTERLMQSQVLENDPPPKPTVPSTPPTDSTSIEALEESIKSSSWFHISDEHVSQVTVNKVLNAQAYLLFYERLL